MLYEAGLAVLSLGRPSECALLGMRGRERRVFRLWTGFRFTIECLLHNTNLNWCIWSVRDRCVSIESHDCCNLIGSANIPAEVTESCSESADPLSLSLSRPLVFRSSPKKCARRVCPGRLSRSVRTGAQVTGRLVGTDLFITKRWIA